MLNLRRILCSRLLSRVLAVGLTLAAAVGCGQRGPLYLPTDPAAANRATLPQILNPAGTSTAPTPAASEPVRGGGTGTGTANPISTP